MLMERAHFCLSQGQYAPLPILQLVPISFTRASEAVAVGNVGVSGIPVELV